MSGTASRNQTRLTYAPGLRIGAYPGQMPSGSQAPIPGTAAPPPVPGVVPVSAAPQASAGVMFGSIRDRERDPALPGSGSEGGMSDASAMSGAPSTGSFLSDLAGFGRAAGPMAAGVAFGGPMGVLSGALGLMGLGIANAINPAFARDVAAAIGLDISDPLGNPAQSGNTTGNFGGGANPAGGALSDPSMTTDPATATGALAGSVAGGMGYGGLDTSGLSGDNSQGDGGMGNPGDGSTSGGGLGGASGEGGGLNDGTGSSDPGDSASAGSTASGWMHGGYTGHGRDGVVQADKPAGTVHEGEVVIPASQVARYGLDPLMMLARGQVEPSRLMALLRS